jgi:ABC-2 type transport system permease protein
MLANKFMDLPFIKDNASVRSFFIAAWLGWQIESNWADPLMFAAYAIARPVASVMILVIMYSVITNGATEKPIFAYIYLGNALYIMVNMVITGVSWTIVDDREHYRVAKQLHTSTLDHYFYLMGRGVARLIIGFVSVLITIVFGMIVYKLPITWATVNWPLLAISGVLGIIALAALGLILGASTMMMARHFWNVGDAVAAALYLFSGAIFPLEMLPTWIRPLGYVMPATYWIELSRRALLGPTGIGFQTFAGLDSLQLTGILAAFTVGLVIVSVYYYRWALHQAKYQGLLDLESGY